VVDTCPRPCVAAKPRAAKPRAAKPRVACRGKAARGPRAAKPRVAAKPPRVAAKPRPCDPPFAGTASNSILRQMERVDI